MTDQDDTTSEQDAAHRPGPRPVGPLDEELDVYPVRPPEEDPRWAVWLVWIWVVIGSASALGIIVFIILGYFYD